MLSSKHARHGSGRPRSGTAGSADSPQTAPSGPQTRPSHQRSDSYLLNLSPVDPKPRNAITMPTEASPPMHGNGTNIADKTGRDKEDESITSSLLPRLHLPGHKARHSQDVRNGGAKDRDRAHGHHLPLPRRTHSHRHTRSEIPQGSSPTVYGEHRNHMTPNMDQGHLHPSAVAGGKSNSMLTRVTTNLSSRQGTKPHHQYSNSDFHKGWHAATAAALTGNGGKPELRRRASSDPRSPAFQTAMGRGALQAQYGVASYIDGPTPRQEQRQKPMTELEVLLYKAEKSLKEAEQNVTEADVQRLSIQLAESNVELQAQLENSNRSASSLMRRLDEAHDMLLSTASSLIDTISSFQNLSLQSSKLIKNFDHRAHALDGETRRMLEKQRAALFDERGTKVAKLERRGKKANERAEEMSRRLENCRTIVKNYTERQQTKRRAWKGVLVGSLWGIAFILSGILLGFALWWYKNYGDIVKYDLHEAMAMTLDQKGSRSGHLHDLVKEGLHQNEQAGILHGFHNVPEEVKAVLEDIAMRHNGTASNKSAMQSTTKQQVEKSSNSNLDGSKKLKKLFDKLEL